MMNKPKKMKLSMIGFRVDPGELEILDNERSKKQMTRSESLRAIINNYINNLMKQHHEQPGVQ